MFFNDLVEPKEELVKQLPFLYGLDTKNLVRVWECKVVWAPTKDHCVIVCNYGLVDGAKVESRRKVTEGKNIGKSNETTIEEQAIAEALSIWKKKKDDNYFEFASAPSAEVLMKKDHVLLPMLAQDTKNPAIRRKCKFPMFLQPKLNGVRSLSLITNSRVVSTSRKGKPQNTISEIQEQLLKVFPENTICDGELYSHGQPLQRIVSAVKREKTSRANIKFNLEFWIYDVILDEPFQKRNAFIEKHLPESTILLKRVPTYIVYSWDQVVEHHNNFVKDGYEGAILRDMITPYEIDVRSKSLLKVKRFADEEFEIVGVEEGTGKDESTAIFVCVTQQGARFSARPKGTWELRNEYWENRECMIGKDLTVRFFNYTEDGIPFHPVGLVIRDYE